MCRITMKHPTHKTAMCKTGNKMAILYSKGLEKIGDATKHCVNCNLSTLELASCD